MSSSSTGSGVRPRGRGRPATPHGAPSPRAARPRGRSAGAPGCDSCCSSDTASRRQRAPSSSFRSRVSRWRTASTSPSSFLMSRSRSSSTISTATAASLRRAARPRPLHFLLLGQGGATVREPCQLGVHTGELEKLGLHEGSTFTRGSSCCVLVVTSSRTGRDQCQPYPRRRGLPTTSGTPPPPASVAGDRPRVGAQLGDPARPTRRRFRMRPSSTPLACAHHGCSLAQCATSTRAGPPRRMCSSAG